ncbi:autotransporter outer membrane beta-barrel domain-containing protein [Rhodanobacter soli]|uniref:autotransporter outer membrane beta-barrel domain-containing protein n=1 Tax=Rhodanobacter soli TaxID=590609 RepID=UPI0031DBCEE2
MENSQGMGAPTREIGGFWLKSCAMAFAVALALGLSGCGGSGGGGANVRPTPAPPAPPPAGSTGFTGGEIIVDSNDVTVLSEDIRGSIDLIKGGTGTLVLAGTDTYTGGTTIKLGTLRIGNGGITGSIVGDVTNNASLVFNRSDDVIFNGLVSGSGSLEQAGAGTLILTGANTYGGGTTISRGILQLGNGGTTGSITGNVTNEASLVFDRSDDVIFSGIVSGSGSLEQAGKGTLFLTGANTYTGDTTISRGILQLGNGGTTGSITGNVTNEASLVFNRSDDVIFNGLVSGSGSLEQAGAGTLILTGANTYTGGTTISRGTLQLGNGGITGSIVGDVTNNGFLVFDRSDNVTFNGLVSGSGSLEQAGPGKLILSGTNTYTGGTTVQGGTLELVSDGAVGIGSVTVDDSNSQNATLTVNGGVSLSNHLVLSNGATLNNAGALVDNVDGPLESRTGTVNVLNHDGGSITGYIAARFYDGATIHNGAGSTISGTREGIVALGGDSITVSNDGGSILSDQGRGLFLSGASVTVTNRDGGVIAGVTGIHLFSAGAVVNESGGIISGDGLYGYGLRLTQGGTVLNDDASIKANGGGTGLDFYNGQGSVINSNGASIESSGIAINMYGNGTVTNSHDSKISGSSGVVMGNGGSVTNQGNSVISALGSYGVAIQISGDTGVVSNIDGGTITGSSIGVFLQHGGTVSNDSGSTIEATGTTGGDCGGTGDCAIFVASASAIPSNPDGEMALINAGTIIGNVQMIPTANNYVALSAGGSIQGDLEIGSNSDSSLVLDGGTGTTQSYSQAVTGTTTFAGSLIKKGDGTWVIDNDELTTSPITVLGGTLQIGDGATKGSIGQYDVNIDGGELMFNRSDAVTFDGNILAGDAPAYYGTLVQAGTGTLTLLASHQIQPTYITIERGTLQMDNTGNLPSDPSSTAIYDIDKYELHADVVNNGSLVFNSNLNIFYGGAISGTGFITQDGSNNLILEAANTYSGGTTINNGVLLAKQVVPGDVTVGEAGVLGRLADNYLDVWMVGVARNLSNAGKVFVQRHNITVGGDYTNASTGTLAVSLGSKLDVAGTAILNGGTLEVTGADSGYVSNTHTNVLTAAGGLTGTFDQLVKGTGVVFTATTINYDANSVWLDTTGLNVTTAAAGQGVSYTPASFGSAQRVQGAFEQLNDKIAAGNLTGVSGDFLRAAGQFQQSPTLLAAQASLQSLSGQLHAASAAMTFKAIDASGRALSDRFDNLLDKGTGFGMWMRNLSIGGDMARTGFDGVGFQLNGWLVGSDRQIGHSGVAGYAFGQSRGQQRLEQSFDHDNSRSTEGMMYAGWLNGNWYTQGRVGFGHFEQDVSRQILLGDSVQGVQTQYSGNYNVAYGESGLHLGRGDSHVTPFVNVQYARIDRGGFAEQGAGGFGLRSNAQTLDRWQAGLGVRAGRHWNLDDGRAVDVSARAQWQRTLTSHGDALDASFVGLQQWQPLVGIGLSRYSGLLGVGLDATLSTRTTLKFGYDYEMGQRDHAQMLSARLKVAL